MGIGMTISKAKSRRLVMIICGPIGDDVISNLGFKIPIIYAFTSFFDEDKQVRRRNSGGDAW